MAERAPDPFRPGEMPNGRPFATAGRSGTSALVVGMIVAVAVGVIVYALLR